AGLIDYAGLFPPAALSMKDGVANYHTYRSSSHAWVLGRLIVPVARLDELASTITESGLPSSPWHISALAGTNVGLDAMTIASWNADHAHAAIVDVVEAKATSVSEVDVIANAFDASVTTYVEIPVHDDPSELIAEIGRAGCRAKIRMGGITVGAFPGAGSVARFITSCAKQNVPFKATAGLHHPLRGEYRLTYEPDAPCGSMYGFVNIFVTAAFARAGMPEELLVELLGEGQASAFEFTGAGMTWRDYALTLNQLAEARGSLATSFGSCSFREPIDDLLQLGLL
ncbi:MAG: hypothetical protein JWM95_5409, partial [Gemmatimonadetes bacterium]|nr:hypothetical protein [Gemmatimonadota bacterium]